MHAGGGDVLYVLLTKAGMCTYMYMYMYNYVQVLCTCTCKCISIRLCMCQVVVLSLLLLCVSTSGDVLLDAVMLVYMHTSLSLQKGATVRKSHPKHEDPVYHNSV